jgi:hypothetical protein
MSAGAMEVVSQLTASSQASTQANSVQEFSTDLLRVYYGKKLTDFPF